jgi:hypothetical protein
MTKKINSLSSKLNFPEKNHENLKQVFLLVVKLSYKRFFSSFLSTNNLRIGW